MAAVRIVPEKKAEASYHPYAECVDEGCTWRAPTSSYAREEAKDHVRYTGHSVRLVAEKVAVWGPK